MSQKKGRKKPSRPKNPKPQKPSGIETALNQGKGLHQAGRLTEAQTVYKQILSRFPDHPETLHLLGIIALQSGQNKVAADLIQKAVKGEPNHPVYLSNLGNAFMALSLLDDAVPCYQKAIKIKPDFTDAHYNLATVFRAQNNTESAVFHYEKALALKPDFINAYLNLGTVFQAQGKSDLAIGKYRTALQIQPGNIAILNNLGQVLMNQGDFSQAMLCFEKIFTIHPDFAEAHYNIGNARYKMGDLDDAIAAFKKAIEIQPDYADAYYNMGTVFQEQHELSHALACFRKTISLSPHHINAQNNLGNTLLDLGCPEQALACFEALIQSKPDFANAHTNKGNALEKMGEMEQSLAAYQKAIELEPESASAWANKGILEKKLGRTDQSITSFETALLFQPDMAEALSELTHQCQHVCQWEKVAVLGDRLDRLTQQALASGEKPSEAPFSNISRHADPALNHAVARAWSNFIARRTANLSPSFDFSWTKTGNRKLTIGYLSNNFRNHPTAHIMLGLFRRHHRDTFNICCYASCEDDGSEYRRQIQADCDRFVDLGRASTLEAAEKINTDQVDILVDLMGHTQNDRMDICSLRPAPVQARYLGMAGTTGADFFDYIIADRIVIPEEDLPFYAETPVWLPHCYQVNNNEQKISDRKWHRSDTSLPENAFVFCSFNTSYKIDPVIFKAWMRILLKVPHSVLWLLSKNQTMENNLTGAAQDMGVDPGRLHFAPKLDKQEHLARMRLADLVLDTRIVGGAASTSDALWAGVPVLTMTGSHFASRMSTSILTAIGMTDLIAKDLAGYEKMAAELALNPLKLEQIKSRLAQNRHTTALFNTDLFTRDLEAAYQKMWEIYLSGKSHQQRPALNFSKTT